MANYDGKLAICSQLEVKLMDILQNMKEEHSKITKNQVEKIDENAEIRLNKYLSDSGFCSRREADRLIEAGKVFVNGKKAVLGTKIKLSDMVSCEGQTIEREEEFILIALNKPEGVECTTDKGNPDNIVDFVGFEKRIYPVGRLDKNSEGLILLTNDGSIVNKIMKAVNGHEKEYIVKVDRDFDDDFLEKMASGVEILDTKTRECKVEKISKNTFRIILTQGLNRQIRRMCEALGYKVTYLKRIRIINIKLGNLPLGEYRFVTKNELKDLLSIIG